MAMIGRPFQEHERRIRLENLAPDIVPQPPFPVMKRGVFGGSNPLDRAHENRSRRQYYLLVESLAVESGMANLNVIGRGLIVKAVQAMERNDQELANGSLAQEVGESLTQVNSQTMAGAHVALSQNFIDVSISRLRAS